MKMFTLSFRTGIAGNRLWDPTSFHHVWLGCLPRVSRRLYFGAVARFYSCNSGNLEQHVSKSWTACFQILNSMFQKQWVRRDETTAWPARSPCLNDFDFYLWGRLKSTVCATCRRETSMGLMWFVRHLESLFRRATSCVEAQEGRFGYFLLSPGGHNYPALGGLWL
jgi:hypothetical protein